MQLKMLQNVLFMLLKSLQLIQKRLFKQAKTTK